MKFWKIARCQNSVCTKVVLTELNAGGIVEQVYPFVNYKLDSNAEIPVEIRDDFREAAVSLGAGCYKSSLVMSRRVLQRCLSAQGCTQNRLVDAINHAVKSNILRPAFHEVAEEVRQYGNLGAHPDDEQLVNANLDSARHVLEFARLLIHEFYEVPMSAAILRKNRQSPSQP